MADFSAVLFDDEPQKPDYGSLLFDEPAAQPQQQPTGFLSRVKEGVESILEPAATMVTGLGSSILGAAAAAPAAAYEVLSGQAGQGKNYPEKAFQTVVDALTYMPRSQGGKENLAAMGRAFQESKIPMAPQITGGVATGALSRLASMPKQFMPDTISPAAPMGRQALKEIYDGYSAKQAAKQDAAAAASRRNAAQFEGVVAADELGIPVLPSARDTSRLTRAKENYVGREELRASFVPAVEQRVEDVLIRNLDLPTGEQITPAALQAGRDVKNQVFNEIRDARLGTLETPQSFFDKINDVSGTKGLSPDVIDEIRGKAAQISERMTQIASNGLSPDDAMALAQEYRTRASQIFSKDPAAQGTLAEARMYRKTADALDEVLEQNLGKTEQVSIVDGRPKKVALPADVVAYRAGLLGKLKEARKYGAATHTVEEALDPTTMRLDLGKLAEGFEQRGATDDFLRIQKAIKNNPILANPVDNSPSALKDHLTRSGLLGTLGYAAGSLLDRPVIGSVIGAALGPMSRTNTANRMVRDALQKNPQGWKEILQSSVSDMVGSPTANQIQMQSVTRGSPYLREIPADARTLRERRGYGRPVAPEPPLTLAPEGELLVPPSPQRPMPEGRGLLSLAEEEAVRRVMEDPGIPMDVKARFAPLYQRGGIDTGPTMPTAPYGGQLPPELPPIAPVREAVDQRPLPVLPLDAEQYIQTPNVASRLPDLPPDITLPPVLDLPVSGVEGVNQSLASLIDDLQRGQEVNPLPGQKFKVQKTKPVRTGGVSKYGANLLDVGEGVGKVEKTFDPRSRKSQAPVAKGEMGEGIDMPLTIDRMADITKETDTLVSKASQIVEDMNNSSGFWVNKNRARLDQTLNDLNDLLESVGIRGPSDLSAAKKLYEGKSGTQLEKAMKLRDQIKKKVSTKDDFYRYGGGESSGKSKKLGDLLL